MLKDKIEYAIQQATETQISIHLQHCNDNFIPALSSRVNIKEYSKKLAEKAVTFEAWAKDKLAGMVAVYFNTGEKNVFITSVSVEKKFMGSGIAGELLARCIEYAMTKNADIISLEVNKDNVAAIALYKKFSFEGSGMNNDNLLMKKYLFRK